MGGNGLNIKKLKNIHPSTLKSFFFILSEDKSIRDIYKKLCKTEDTAFIFVFWLFGSYMAYIRKNYRHHKFVNSINTQHAIQSLQNVINTYSKESIMLSTLFKNLELFDGTRSKETICHILGVEENIYDQFVDLMHMRESYHTHKSKLFL